ncbi:ribonucleotide reductase inhibitor-domain-containing protein [Dactylonectria estremocensis]|uniref:Ribonucleotide reductase inhibitor-domain-containing protein n=1 Tax=Dactylonectria estremocensis TaxID=1079267 RepID=A0A9P9IMS1_9HYPO|nr:ribonucleotide reductase inhibitor-domain-containing protein [Dactylonectria estremocensis]
MSTPRTKRQFAGASADPAQRQITSFFNTKSTSDSPTTTDAIRTPELPSSIQANLLSVGMRVRKSVPEGYKTVGPSAFKLWTDNAPLPTPSTARAPIRASSRELLPFCGINRVGGLDTQPEFENDVFEVPDLDAIPELSMSQESNESVDSSPESSRKRIFDDREDVDVRREASPGTLTPGGHGNARILAVPRSRTKPAVPFKGFGQENMAADDDFDDAEFLVFDAEKEMDMTN